jgi:hypothetical protein
LLAIYVFKILTDPPRQPEPRAYGEQLQDDERRPKQAATPLPILGRHVPRGSGRPAIEIGGLGFSSKLLLSACLKTS